MDVNRYQSIRQTTEELCDPLEIEDFVIQSCDDVSPPKWHLAHTTWFFETFVLVPYLKNYTVFNSSFTHLFNSYYQSINNPYPRAKRGLLSRPTVKEIFFYRKHVDQCMEDILSSSRTVDHLVELGLQHEQQHQELLLMDIKHNLYENKNYPSYVTAPFRQPGSNHLTNSFSYQEGGIIDIGYEGKDFSYDNETPRHQKIISPFLISSGLVTNLDFLEFVEAGGYANPNYWLSDGWECVQKYQWNSPLYWKKINNQWHTFTLNGLQPLNLSHPVVHVSYYEADAFARWSDKRLPTEEEWEYVVNNEKLELNTGNFLEDRLYHPNAPNKKNHLNQFFGDVWEWTRSPYTPYPGYKPLKGALGEYNGKFMSNQHVLRGGSCVTPKGHMRPTYRNFFQPEKRWAFSGIRLADDV